MENNNNTQENIQNDEAEVEVEPKQQKNYHKNN